MVGGMDIEAGGITKEQGEKGQSGYSIIQIVIASIMLWQGSTNIKDKDVLPISPTGDDPPCQNGAAEYLWFAGIVLLVVNLLGFFGGIAQKCAEKDGKITTGENCGLKIIGAITMLLFLADFGMMIWGSVVIFGAYSDWTYETSTAATENFCDYTCFTFAFVLLILRWIMVPFAMCCGVMKCCGKMCSKGGE